MRVVEGNFGKDEKNKPTLSQSLKEILEMTELGDTNDHDFVLIVDGPQRMSFMTNIQQPQGVVFLLEQIKFSLLAGGVSQYE